MLHKSTVCHFPTFSPPLSMHLVQYSTKFVIPLWEGEKKVLCCMWNNKCNDIFSDPHIWNKNPSNSNFYRSKHVELTRREVQTVRRWFQDLKFQISDQPFKCLASCLQIGLLCCKITDCDNCPLRYVQIASFSSSVKRAQ